MRRILPILVLLALSTQASANSSCSTSSSGHGSCSISCGSGQAAICQRGTGSEAPTCSCAPVSSPASPEPQKSVPKAGHDFVEETNFLAVTIAGHLVRLEGLIVKRADSNGRLPVALLGHGMTLSPALRLNQHPQDLLGQARDLAFRGWLAVVVMRRGYGESDGPVPVDISCTKPVDSLREAFAADADDLQATLDVVRQRADADSSRMMVVGESAGGIAGAALAARNPGGLLAAISIAGGLRSDSCRLDDALTEAYKSYGAQSRVPSLWIYAKNDQLISPDLVERLHAAFLAGGGNVKLVMLNPIGENGHDIFHSGRPSWLSQLDAFLRVRQLPTWDLAEVDAVFSKLRNKGHPRTFIEGYLSAPLDKALAESSVTGVLGANRGARTQTVARESAIQACVDQVKVDQANNPPKTPEARNESCEIVMERNRWVR